MSAAGAPFAFVEPGAYAEPPAGVPSTDDAACRGALDRADALREDPAALAALWPTARVMLLDAEGCALANGDRSPYAPRGAELRGVGSTDGVFLGLDADGAGWFGLEATQAGPHAPARVDLRTAAASWPHLEAAVFAQARALQHWRRRHRYCGSCGGELEFVRGGWLGRCRTCALEHYPRTDPAAIVAVTDGERLLLGRNAGWAPRRYSLVAGFVEPGETLEQTVAREVLEETGVRVRACHYLASQPWPFPGQLMLGFIALAHPDQPRVGDELEDARWLSVAEVRAAMARDTRDDGGGVLLSPGLSISRWLIEHWVSSAGG